VNTILHRIYPNIRQPWILIRYTLHNLLLSGKHLHITFSDDKVGKNPHLHLGEYGVYKIHQIIKQKTLDSFQHLSILTGQNNSPY
jgi:hypothetical protein